MTETAVVPAAPPPSPLLNRIVGHGVEAPDQLLANPANWRVHPAYQQESLLGVLEKVGWVQSVIVNQRTGHLVDGHLRVTLAMRRGEAEIPVAYVDLSEEEEALILTTIDPIAGLAVADNEKLGALLAQVRSDDARVNALLATVREQHHVPTTVLPPEVKDPDAVPEPRPDPITRRGEVIKLGDHILVCGDSKDARAWDALLDGEKADLVWTDPPYGVNMAEKNEAQARMSGHANAQAGREIANDDLDPEALLGFLRDVFALALVHTRPGACWYVAGPPGPHSIAFGRALSEISVWRQTLVWVKNALVLGRSDYHYRCELIFYGWSPGAAHHPVPTRDQDNVWEVPRPAKSPDHPTTKPVALVQRAIENSTDPGEIVVDAFGGSGTTLIACEMTGRKARLIEISPGYCDVIVRRWEEATGKTAERIADFGDADDLEQRDSEEG